MYKEVGNQHNTFYCYTTYADKYTDLAQFQVAKQYVDSCFQLAPILDTDGRDFYKGMSHHTFAKLLKKEKAIQEFNAALLIYTAAGEETE